MWQEVTKHTTTGTLLKRQSRTVRRWIRYGDTFEKSFEQSTSFWHFRDAYLADFRQDESETTADLDLCIKQTVRGCQ